MAVGRIVFCLGVDFGFVSLMARSIMSIWWSESKNESSFEVVFLIEFLNLSWIRQKSSVEKCSVVHGGAKYGDGRFFICK